MQQKNYIVNMKRVVYAIREIKFEYNDEGYDTDDSTIRAVFETKELAEQHFWVLEREKYIQENLCGYISSVTNEGEHIFRRLAYFFETNFQTKILTPKGWLQNIIRVPATITLEQLTALKKMIEVSFHRISAFEEGYAYNRVFSPMFPRLAALPAKIFDTHSAAFEEALEQFCDEIIEHSFHVEGSLEDLTDSPDILLAYLAASPLFFFDETVGLACRATLIAEDIWENFTEIGGLIPLLRHKPFEIEKISLIPQ